jgi:hypothetical protein
VALSEKQLAALQDAQSGGGRIFQLPENRRHSPATLHALVAKGLLERKPVGVIWGLTAAGAQALLAAKA